MGKEHVIGNKLCGKVDKLLPGEGIVTILGQFSRWKGDWNDDLDCGDWSDDLDCGDRTRHLRDRSQGGLSEQESEEPELIELETEGLGLIEQDAEPKLNKNLNRMNRDQLSRSWLEGVQGLDTLD